MYPKETNQKTLPEVIKSVIDKADLGIKTINNQESLCCGMAFASKGYHKQSIQLSEKLYNAIRVNIKSKDTPVLFDTSPCAMHFMDFIRTNHKEEIKVCDPVEFAHLHLAGKVDFGKIPETILLHPVCSVKRNNYADKLSAIVHLCAENVIVTEPVGCCGFAGDKGIKIPELNKSALSELPLEHYAGCREGYSTSRMCEIGMTRELAVPFNSIFYLLDKSIISKKK